MTGLYENVRVSDDATVTLGAGTFDIRELSVGMDVTFVVDGGTILKIDRGFDPNNGLKFGIGTGSGARITVGAIGYNPNSNALGRSPTAERLTPILLADGLARHWR